MINEALEKGGHLADDVARVVVEQRIPRGMVVFFDRGEHVGLITGIYDVLVEDGRRELDPEN